MTRIESKQVDIAKPAAQVYAFLQDMNNFQQLLPADRISEWKSDGTSCSFKVQGAATIGLKLDGGTPDSVVRMVPPLILSMQEADEIVRILCPLIKTFLSASA